MGNKGTFSLNKFKPFYSWYQYVEGYSEELVSNEIDLLSNITAIYDPFGGSGTTMLYSSLNGIDSYYSETNPLMNWVSNTKINSAIKAFQDIEKVINYQLSVISKINSYDFDSVLIPNDGFEKFYDLPVYKKILGVKNIIENSIIEPYIKDIFLIALISNVVQFSNMQKNGDLRYATQKELSRKNKNVVEVYTNKLNEIINDLINHGHELKTSTTLLANDSRDINESNLVDCIVTSPPYLNGTNYIRNTKLELNILGFIKNEKDLPNFHSKGIIAGINNVSRRNFKLKHSFSFIEDILANLRPITYDERIPLMIQGYFDNMYEVFQKMAKILKNEGVLILDIGDSQFSGIHIPTHDLLEKIANLVGFIKYDEEILRKRTSNGGMVLSQRLLKFVLKKEHTYDI